VSDNLAQTFVNYKGHFKTIDGVGDFSNIVGINDKGQVAINSSTGGWIYDANTGNLTPVSPVTSGDLILTDINNNGIVVGTGFDQFSGEQSGFIYDTATGVGREFDMVPGKQTEIDRINDKGSISGTYIDRNDVGHAFLATASDLHNPINLDGISLVEGMNNNDFVVGWGSSISGVYVYGGTQTNNKVMNFTPTNTSASVRAINDSNVIAGSLPINGGGNPFYGNPIYG